MRSVPGAVATGCGTGRSLLRRCRARVNPVATAPGTDSMMNYSVLSLNRRGFRACLLLFAFGLASSSLSAAPCSQTNSQQDAWVTQRVDALIRTARALYE